jgi:exodeoxyribonuclease VII small subunit
MTDEQSQPTGDTIAAKTDRLETIIATLEAGDVSLEEAQQLHAEGQSLIEDLETELDLGDGEIIDRS